MDEFIILIHSYIRHQKQKKLHVNCTKQRKEAFYYGARGELGTTCVTNSVKEKGSQKAQEMAKGVRKIESKQAKGNFIAGHDSEFAREKKTNKEFPLWVLEL